MTAEHSDDVQTANDGVQDATYNITTTNNLDPFISFELRRMIVFMNRVTIGQVLAIFGVLSNIINMVVLYKMGFKESINISLFSLAISDFMSSLTLAWSNTWYTPVLLELDWPFHPQRVRYVTGDLIRVIFTKITGCTTAFIAFERCMCVTFPLKVKTLITRRRVVVIIGCLWVLVFVLQSPNFYLSYQILDNDNSSDIGGILSTTLGEYTSTFEKVLLSIRGVFLYWFLFGFTLLSSIGLVVNLKKQSKWRNKATIAEDSSQMSPRDAKVAAMVMFVCAVFIVCFTPVTVMVLATFIEPGLASGMRYNNTFVVLASFNYIFESVNASTNIFIYYFRSSRYKSTFQKNFIVISCHKVTDAERDC